MEAEIVTENPLKLLSLFQPNAGASRLKGKNMDSTYQRAMNANVTPQIFSTMVSNAQKVAESFAGSGSTSVDADSIAEVFSRMVVAQIEMFEKK